MTRFPPKPNAHPISVQETHRDTMKRFPKAMEALRQSDLALKHPGG